MNSLIRVALGVIAAFMSSLLIMGAAVLSLAEDSMPLTPTSRPTSIHALTRETPLQTATQPNQSQIIPVTALIIPRISTSVAGDWLLDSVKTSVPQVCPPTPANWFRYQVQPGDILSALSVQFGVKIADIQYYNCLGSSDIIRYGEILFLPEGFPPTPLVSPTPEPTLTPTVINIIIPTSLQTETPSPSPTEPVEETDVPTQTETPAGDSGS